MKTSYLIPPRNTAINSFGPGETVNESKIRQKMKEIKQREKENIKGIKLQKALQSIVISKERCTILLSILTFVQWRFWSMVIA